MNRILARIGWLAASCAAAAVFMGCSTTLQDTVYDSHRRIVKLEEGMDGSVTKLNETTAELVARVDASDQQTRTLQSMLEENQHKLEQLQKSVDTLMSTVYRVNNLTGGTGMPAGTAPVTAPQGSSEVEAGEPAILPGPGAAPMTPPGVTPVPGATPAQPAAPAAATAAVDTTASGNPEVDYQKAQKSYADEKYDQAYAQFDAYLQRYPNVDANFSANAQFWKGYCCYNLNKPEDAVSEFEKLRTNYPSSTKVPFGMYIQAMAHKQLGQKARAVELLQNVVDNYPVNSVTERAKTELEKLKSEGQ